MNKKNSEEDLYKYLSHISHDIRSPLSALNLVFSTINNLSEDKAKLIKDSILRINKIADELMFVSQNKIIEAIPAENTNFQLAPPPAWFKAGLSLKIPILIVIIDDDPTIHDMWKNKLNLHKEITKKNVLHFTSITDFRDWHYSDHNHKNIFYFVDLEFENEMETGLGLIEKLNLSSKSILVTSRYDDQWVVDKAQKLNLKIMPKSIASEMPLKFIDCD